MEKMFHRYNAWYHQQVGRVARETNPEYDRIETIRDEHRTPNSSVWLDDTIGLGWHENEYQQAVETAIEATQPWRLLRIPLKIYWWLERHGPSAQWSRLRDYHERGRRGWSVRDAWNLHSWHAKVIADSVEYLRDECWGYPGGLTEDEWGQILTEIADGFRLTIQKISSFDEFTPDEETQIADAFALYHRWFFHLWD